jgi:hypothetical protein
MIKNIPQMFSTSLNTNVSSNGLNPDENSISNSLKAKVIRLGDAGTTKSYVKKGKEGFVISFSGFNRYVPIDDFFKASDPFSDQRIDITAEHLQNKRVCFHMSTRKKKKKKNKKTYQKPTRKPVVQNAGILEGNLNFEPHVGVIHEVVDEFLNHFYTESKYNATKVVVRMDALDKVSVEFEEFANRYSMEKLRLFQFRVNNIRGLRLVISCNIDHSRAKFEFFIESSKRAPTVIDEPRKKQRSMIEDEMDQLLH